MSEFAAYRLTALGMPFDAKRFPIQLAELDLADADLVVALKKTEHLPMMQTSVSQVGGSHHLLARQRHGLRHRRRGTAGLRSVR